jgi:uncharacterized OB-fold protein
MNKLSPVVADGAAEIDLAGGALSIGVDGPVLNGGACGDCRTEFFPIQAVCPSCMSEDVAEKSMATRGTLYSFTTLHVGAPKWRKPLNVGYVDLDNGVRVFAHLEGESFTFDQPMELAVGKVGADQDGRRISTFIFKAVEA